MKFSFSSASFPPILSSVLFCTLLFLLVLPFSLAFIGSGAGTSGDPYVITSRAELEDIDSDLSAYYVLGNDIDLLGSDWDDLGTFTGTLDGQGYTIWNLTEAAGGSDYGFFGDMNGGTIQNIVFNNADVTTSTGSDVGIVIGQFDSGVLRNITLYNSTVARSSTSGSYLGGLVGYTLSNTLIENINMYNVDVTARNSAYNGIFTGRVNGPNATINDVYIDADSSLDVTSGTPAYGGGLAGAASYEVIIDNVSIYASLYANAADNWGGFIGYYITSPEIAVSNSHFGGNLYGEGVAQYLGSVVGYSNTCLTCSIVNTTASNIIIDSTGSYVGGLVGYFIGSASNLHINNSYVANASISGATYVGGLIGRAHASSITADLSLNRVFVDKDTVVTASGNDHGGLIGYISYAGAGATYNSVISVEDSYSRAIMNSSNADVGGLTGAMQFFNTVFNRTYFAGNLSLSSSSAPLVDNSGSGSYGTLIDDSYWDNVTSPSTNEHGEGKTTQEMKTQSTYEDWDFTDVWAIHPVINDGYPYLLGVTPIDPIVSVNLSSTAVLNESTYYNLTSSISTGSADYAITINNSRTRLNLRDNNITANNAIEVQGVTDVIITDTVDAGTISPSTSGTDRTAVLINDSEDVTVEYVSIDGSRIRILDSEDVTLSLLTLSTDQDHVLIDIDDSSSVTLNTLVMTTTGSSTAIDIFNTTSVNLSGGVYVFSSDGIILNATSGTVDSPLITGGGSADGIKVDAAENLTFTGLDIGAFSRGLYADPGSGVTVESSTFSDATTCVEFDAYNDSLVSSSTFTNCTTGVFVHSSSDSINVSTSTFTDSDVGVNVSSSSDVYVWNNTFTNSATAHVAVYDSLSTYLNRSVGNIWDDVPSLTITDNDADDLGDAGAQYPYSAANGANIIGVAVDYAPYTSSAPSVSSVTIASSSGTNTSVENLTVSYFVSDNEDDPVKNITDWQFYNSSTSSYESFADVLLFFEGGSAASTTPDYSSRASTVEVSSATWNVTGGHDGYGAYEFDGSSSVKGTISSSGTTGKTIAFWAKNASSDTWNHYVNASGTLYVNGVEQSWTNEYFTIYGSTLFIGGTSFAEGSQDFNHTGADQQFQVPTGVSQVTAKLWGAAGGAGTYSSGGPGGAGGYTQVTFTATPLENLTIVVGEGGVQGGLASASYGGGTASGGTSGGGNGGGLSGIFNGSSSMTFDASGQARSIAIAGAGGGGGGGGSPNDGGAGGGAEGESITGGGGGGTQSAGGSTYSTGTAGSALKAGYGSSGWGSSGGAGYFGAGGASHSSGNVRPGGGGSGFINSSRYVSGFTVAGSGNTPPYQNDSDYVSGIGVGPVADSTDQGGHGRVVISYSSGVASFNGSIDDFMVFNRELSAAQIEALYNNDLDTLVADELTVNDQVRACVTPTDNTGKLGAQVCSDAMTIAADSVSTIQSGPTVDLFPGPPVVNFTFDKATTTTTYYNEDGQALDLTINNTDASTTQSIEFPALSTETTYKYYIQFCNTDGACNTTSNYTFTTPNVSITYDADIVAEQSFSLNGTVLLNGTAYAGVNVSASSEGEGGAGSYGDGSDGELSVSSSQQINNYTHLTSSASADDTSITVSDGTAFEDGDEILIIKMQDTDGADEVGHYEFATISSGGGTTTLTLESGLTNNYSSGSFNTDSADSTQIVRVPQYTSVTVESSGELVPKRWDGFSGGILVFRSQGTVDVDGAINATNAGYRGSDTVPSTGGIAARGESYRGVGEDARTVVDGGGTNAQSGGCAGCGGGGGAYGEDAEDIALNAKGGDAYGSENLSRIYLGSGGSGGYGAGTADEAASGGGIIYAFAPTFDIAGSVISSSSHEVADDKNKGGGSGGSIYLLASTISGAGDVDASGGPRGASGYSGRFPGAGSVGRIRLDFETFSLSGSVSPAQYNGTFNLTEGVSSSSNSSLTDGSGDFSIQLIGPSESPATISVNIDQHYYSNASSNITVTVPDTTAPVISATSATVYSTDVVFEWTTDENATSVVYFGTATGNYTNTSSNSTLTTDHSTNISGFTSSTTYYYLLSSCDSSGNCANSSESTVYINDAPTVAVTLLSASNSSGDDINISVNYSDVNSDSNQYTIIDYRESGTSLAVFNSQFENANDDTSVVVDYSSYSHNATVTGATWNESSGRNGTGGYYFDGDDTISVTDNADLTLDGEFTIELWTKTTHDGSGCHNALFGTGNYDATGGISVFKHVGEYVTLYIDDTSNVITGATVINDGDWHHVVVVRDNGFLKLYVDGQKEGSDYAISDVLDGSYFTLGYSGDTCDTHYTGYIDDVFIANGYAFTEDMIDARYANNTRVVDSGMLGIADSWSACASVNDGYAEATSCSDSLTIATPGSLNITNVTVMASDNLGNYDANLTGNMTTVVDGSKKEVFDWQYYDGSSFTSVALANFPFEGESGSTVTDRSTTGLLGNVTGATWSSNTGRDGYGAVEFDGTDDYIDLGSSEAFDFGNNGPFTFAAWINVDVAANYDGLFAKKASGTTTSYSFMLTTYSGNKLASYGTSSGWDQSTGTFTDNQWQHVAFTYDGTDLIYYINGANAGSRSFSYTDNSDYEVSIGRWRHSSIYPFDGHMDDVFIYNYSLSPEQIAALADGSPEVLVSNETDVDDILRVCAQASDGTYLSPQTCSSNITIVNETGFTVSGSAASVNGTNTSNITVQVANAAPTGSKYFGMQQVQVQDNGTTVVTINHNFSSRQFNFSQIRIEKDNAGSPTKIRVNFTGLNTSLGESKTLTLPDNGFAGICVVNKEIASLSLITENCTGTDEIPFKRSECDSGATKEAVTCTYENAAYSVSGLSYSGVGGSYAPYLTNVGILSSSGENRTTDQLYTTGTRYDQDGSSTKKITDWQQWNGTSWVSNEVLYYSFDGGTTETYARDYSQNGLDIVDGVDMILNETGGPDGFGSYVFNGSAYAEINNSVFDYLADATHVTLATWVKTNHTGSQVAIVSINSASAPFDGPTIEMGGTGLLKVVNGRVAPNSAFINCNACAAINDGDWHHVAVVFRNGTDGNVSFYVDGEFEETVSSILDITTDDTTRATLGRPANSVTRLFVGELDELRVYNRELTAGEISDLYDYTDVLSASATAAEDVWRGCLVANDGTYDGVGKNCTSNITINSLPTVSDVAVVSSNISLNDTSVNLNVIYTSSDSNSDPVYNATNWRRSGSIPTDRIIFNATLESDAQDAISAVTGTVSGATYGAALGQNSDGAYSFDGNDYIDYGALSNFDRAYRYFTVAAWAYPTDLSASARQYVVSKHDGTDLSFGLGFDNGNPYFGVDNKDKDGGETAIAGSSLSNNTWYHLAGVVDTYQGTLRLYVNGEEVANTAYSSNFGDYGVGTTNANLVIGADNSSGHSNYLTGRVEDVVIFEDVLGGSALKKLMDGTGPVSDAIYYYPFDHVTDTISGELTYSVTDYSNPVTFLNATHNQTGGLNGSGAAQFESASTNEILFGTPAEIDFGSNGAYTAAAWVYSDSFSSYGGIWSKKALGNFNSYVYLNTIHSDGRLATFSIVSPIGWKYSDSSLSTSTWHHVAYVYDGSQIKFYIDGSESGSDTMNYIDYTGFYGYLGFWEANTFDYPFNGLIDDFRLYDRALSNSQIEALANQRDQIVANEIAAGDLWSACVTPTDTKDLGTAVCSGDFTVLGYDDDPPTLTALDLATSSEGNYSNETLSLTATATDDLSTPEISVEWFKDDSIYYNYSYRIVDPSGGRSVWYHDFDTSASSELSGYSSSFDNAQGVSYDTNAGLNGTGAYLFEADDTTDYLDLYTPSQIDFDNNDPFTVMAWVNVSSLPQSWNEYATVYGRGQNPTSSGTRVFYMGIMDSGRLMARGDGSVLETETASLISEGQWHHVAWKFNGSEVFYYVDGVARGSDEMEYTQSTSYNTYVGNFYDSQQHPFDGVIDELRVYDEAISDEEIIAVYHLDEGRKLEMNSSETNVGDVWHACVQVHDGFYSTTQNCTANLTVLTDNLITLNDVVFNSTGTNVSDDNLTTTVDVTGTVDTYVYDYRLNNNSIMVLNLPFEAVSTNETFSKDYSSYGNDVTATNAYMGQNDLFEPGYGYSDTDAYYFDGIGNKSVADNENFTFAGDFAVELRMKTLTGDVSTCGDALFATQDKNLTGGISIWYENDTTVSLSVNGTERVINTSTSVNSTQWHHVVLSRINNVFRLFIDGQDEGNFTYAGTLNSTYVRLGYADQNMNCPGGDDSSFFGYMDDIRVYNGKGLTAAQVALEYANASYASTTTLDSSMTSVGENWSVCVSALDATQEPQLCSDTVTISQGQTAPTLSSVILNSSLGTNLSTENLTAHITASDANGDSLKNITDWQLWNTSASEYQSAAVLHTPFEAESSNSVTRDYSTWNQTFAQINGVSWSASAGQDGFGAYEFDGDSDYIVFNDSASLRPAHAITVMAWVYPSGATTGQRYVVEKRELYGLRLNSLTPEFIAKRQSTGIYQTASAGTTVSADSWTHLAAVFDGTNLMIYINGTQTGTPAALGSTIKNDDLRELAIGANAGNLNNAEFEGTIDDVMIFDRALSAEQIMNYVNGDSNVLDTNDTSIDDVWQACVIVSDGSDVSDETCSNNLTVLSPNTAPTVPDLVSPLDISTTNRTLTFDWNASTDVDGDNITYELHIDNDVNFGSLDYNITTNDTEYTNPSVLDVDTTYYWRVRASDGTEWSSFSSTGNVTVQSYVAITVINTNVSFAGQLLPGETANSSAGDATPFTVRNDGNIDFNITISATPLFNNSAMPSVYYQYVVEENESSAFTTGSSTMSWTNMRNTTLHVDVVDLAWEDSADDFTTQIFVEVPAAEPGGDKSSTVTFETS